MAMSESEEEQEEVKRQRFIGFEEDLSDIEIPEALPIPKRSVATVDGGDCNPGVRRAQG